MKNLFAILLVTALTSCGGSSSSEPAEAREQSAALEPPKSNTDYINIIGKPIKIANLEIAQYDFPRGIMNWNDAKKACEALGDGWRLPTYKELNILYQNKVAIGGFEFNNYWSSTEEAIDSGAFYQDFVDGNQNGSNKVNSNYVRAVRALEQSAAKSTKQNIIGKSIKIGNLEIAQYDFAGTMNWNDAKIACEALGDGWRLPSLDELNILYQNKVAIGGFEFTNYWSSDEYDGTETEVWTKSFVNGQEPNHFKKYTNNVRAVRAF